MTTKTLKKYDHALNMRGKLRQGLINTSKNTYDQSKSLLVIMGALALLVLIFYLINPAFLNKYTMITMVQKMTPTIILGLGVTFVIASGGIDLSIGTVMIASTLLAGMLWNAGLSLELALIAMIGFGTLFGVFNGFLVAKCKMPPFIATLGTMLMSRGISAMLFDQSSELANLNYPSGEWMRDVFANTNDFPIGIVWIFGIMLVCMYLMFKSKIGRYILAIGSNEEATRLSGINVAKYKMLAYIISGVCAGIAAIFYVAYNPTITPATGNGLELDAIAGVYVGGTSAAGGSASVVGSVVGGVILAILSIGIANSMQTFGISVNTQYLTYAVTGVVVLLAILLDVYKKSKDARVKVELSQEKYKKAYKEQIAALKVDIDYILSNPNQGKAENEKQAALVRKEIEKIKNEAKVKLVELKKSDDEKIKSIKTAQQEAKRSKNS